MLHTDLLLLTLPILGYGMLGVFLATGIMIGMVVFLKKVAHTD